MTLRTGRFLPCTLSSHPSNTETSPAVLIEDKRFRKTQGRQRFTKNWPGLSVSEETQTITIAGFDPEYILFRLIFSSIIKQRKVE